MANFYGAYTGFGGGSGGPFEATGGDDTDTYTGYSSHTFTSSGTFTVTGSAGVVDIMIVAGGGGSGGKRHSGGGGAGGVRVLTSQTVAVGDHTVTIGAGGAQVGSTAGDNVVGDDGNNSSFASLSATFGGGGATYNTDGRDGGSGGGDSGGDYSVNYSPGAGNAGSYSPVEGYAGAETAGNGSYVAGGGGGGASETGGHTSKISDGGQGISNDYRTGSNVDYGGGGVGSTGYSSTGQSGTPAASHGGGVMDVEGAVNTGGGGGAPSAGSGANAVGRAGGSGIVVIRYAV